MFFVFTGNLEPFEYCRVWLHIEYLLSISVMFQKMCQNSETNVAIKLKIGNGVRVLDYAFNAPSKFVDFHAKIRESIRLAAPEQTFDVAWKGKGLPMDPLKMQ